MRTFPDLDDQILAGMSDLQGMGSGRVERRQRESAEASGQGAHASMSSAAH
jgi:hypothetical protein